MRASLFALLLLGCSSGSTSSAGPETEEPPEHRSEPPSVRRAGAPAGRMVDGFFVAEGAPAEPTACETADDCTTGGVPRADGCCWSYRDVNAVAMSKVYHAWVHEQRREHCEVDGCPPPPTPTAPEDCLFELRCAEGRCVNACGR